MGVWEVWQEASVLSDGEVIDLEALHSPQGWVPYQDRWADFDLLNTTYIRPQLPHGDDKAEEGFVRYACGVLEGKWRARALTQRGTVVWTNSDSLVELHLTPDGLVFLSDTDEWNSTRPEAVRVEYGMCGCKDGVNLLHRLSNKQARRLLNLPHPRLSTPPLHIGPTMPSSPPSPVSLSLLGHAALRVALGSNRER